MDFPQPRSAVGKIDQPNRVSRMLKSMIPTINTARTVAITLLFIGILLYLAFVSIRRIVIEIVSQENRQVNEKSAVFPGLSLNGRIFPRFAPVPTA